MQIFLHLPHVFATVGHEHYLLVLLHPLRLHHLPHPLPRLLVIRLHEAEAFRWRHQISFRPPERHHTAARDHCGISLLVGCPHVATVDTNRHWTIRQGEFGDRSSPSSCSMRSATACKCSRTVCELVASATGSTSFNKSTAFSNGIREAHLVSRYSISGLVRAPCSHAALGRNVRGPSVWQGQRSHRGLGTSTGPNTVFTVCVPASLL